MTAAALDYQTRLAAFDLGPTPAPALEEKKERPRALRIEQQRRQEAEWFDYAFRRARLLTSDERRDWHEVHSRYSGPCAEQHRAGILHAERETALQARARQAAAAWGCPAGRVHRVTR